MAPPTVNPIGAEALKELRFEHHREQDIPRQTLGRKEIHIWSTSLEVDEAGLRRWHALLELEERDRAERFHFPIHRRHFIVSHGVLRVVLSAYRHESPQSLRFHEGKNGKPHITPRAGILDLEFNLSHSGKLALIAVCARAAVGVDIEQIRVVDEAATIAQRFFSKAEHAELCTLPESDRSLAFMRCWTRKEAYLKATGDGLSAPLDQFDVTISASEPARMRVLEGSAERAAAWSLHSLAPADGYVGALAVFGCAWRIKCRSLSPARLRLPHP